MLPMDNAIVVSHTLLMHSSIHPNTLSIPTIYNGTTMFSTRTFLAPTFSASLSPREFHWAIKANYNVFSKLSLNNTPPSNSQAFTLSQTTELESWSQMSLTYFLKQSELGKLTLLLPPTNSLKIVWTIKHSPINFFFQLTAKTPCTILLLTLLQAHPHSSDVKTFQYLFPAALASRVVSRIPCGTSQSLAPTQ